MDCQLACFGQEMLDRFEPGQMIGVIAIVLGCGVAVVSIVASSISRICVGRSQEQTRRELAAYVAEGSLDADKAVAMLNAGVKHKGGCCG